MRTYTSKVNCILVVFMFWLAATQWIFILYFNKCSIMYLIAFQYWDGEWNQIIIFCKRFTNYKQKSRETLLKKLSTIIFTYVRNSPKKHFQNVLNERSN